MKTKTWYAACFALPADSPAAPPLNLPLATPFQPPTPSKEGLRQGGKLLGETSGGLGLWLFAPSTQALCLASRAVPLRLINYLLKQINLFFSFGFKAFIDFINQLKTPSNLTFAFFENLHFI